jgi:hypothetical protein
MWYIWKHSPLWSGTMQNSQMYLPSLALFLVKCANTVLPSRILLLAMFTLHNFPEDVSTHHLKVAQGVHMRPTWGVSWWSQSHWSVSDCDCAASIWSGAQAFALAPEILCISILIQDLDFHKLKWIQKCTIYKPQCNFLCLLYSFPQKRIIGQVLIGSVNSLHEHIVLRNAKRLEIKSEMISSSQRASFFLKRFCSCATMHQVLTHPNA